MSGEESGFVYWLLTKGGKQPNQVARTTLILAVITWYFLRAIRFFLQYGIVRGLGYANQMKKSALKAVYELAKKTFAAKQIRAQMAEIKEGLQESLLLDCEKGEEKQIIMPEVGLPEDNILSRMEGWSKIHRTLWDGKKQISSGTVYFGDEEMKKFQNKAYGMFSLSNPLHPDVFPFVRKMECEIISMTVDMLNGGEEGCGILTSGGTESIICAIRAYRNWARATKNITQPELILPVTAHAAFDKACEMMNIEKIHVPVDPVTHRVDPDTIRSLCTSNTIAIVAGAPSYAQGVLDPIQDLAKIAVEKNIGFHVDACLGSFLICNLTKLGYSCPPFDFRVPGVSSMSCDTHKYGFAAKGTSVLSFANEDWRKWAYYIHHDWTGGVYATPTIQGSRSGGVIAATWAAMMRLGKQGYIDSCREIMDEVEVVKAGSAKIPELKIQGSPLTSVIAWESNDPRINIYAVAGGMQKRGWTLNKLQNPPGIHICVTYVHRGKGKDFINAMKEVVEDIKANPDDYKGGDVALYGTMATLPDGVKDGVLDEVCRMVWDVLLAPVP